MKLSKEELQQLIDTYRTELRLLTYRSKQVSDQLKGLEREERAAKPKKRAGRPAKKAAAKKRGRPAKKAAKKRGRPAKKAAGKRGRPAKKAAGKRARPAKKAAGKRARPAKKAAGKRGRPAKKAAAKGGYRLNAWDEIVLKAVRGKKQPGVFSDFFAAAKRNPASKGLSQKDLYARINQSLHKLANKRGVLKKVGHEGRGFGYALV